MEDSISTVISCTSVTQTFIESKSLFTHFLSNILGVLYSKESEGQNSMAEEDLKSTTILGSGLSIYIFINPKLVTNM